MGNSYISPAFSGVPTNNIGIKIKLPTQPNLYLGGVGTSVPLSRPGGGGGGQLEGAGGPPKKG